MSEITRTRWTEEEDAILTANIGNTYLSSIEKLAAAGFKRSKWSIKDRIAKIRDKIDKDRVKVQYSARTGRHRKFMEAGLRDWRPPQRYSSIWDYAQGKSW